VSLRAKLTIAFAVFAAVPVLAMLWPVSRALSDALEAEYAARLDQAASAVEREYRRLAAEAAAAARETARSPEVEALARDRSQPGFDPAEAATRAAGWMQARGLDVLAVADAEGVVLSSGHLPGRAGDADPDLRVVFAGAPAGRAVPRAVARATPEGVEAGLAAVAWDAVPAADPPLRVAAGLALGASFAARLAALTGGEVAVRSPDSARPVAEAAPRGRARELAGRLIGATRARTREIPIPSAAAPLATIEVTLPASGLARAQATVALALLAALALAVLAATVFGHLVARRITRPVEALRDGAARVARGELGTRVEVRAAGEVKELLDAFNGMTADLAATTARAAAAERVAAWREVARRLAHEVKNPLTPVAMSVETLRDAFARNRPDFAEIFEEGTRAIGEEVRRLARIVDEFGRFARLPAPDPRPIGAEELLTAALALYPEEQGAVRVEREIERGLPVVDVDRDQLLQVLHNLVRNGIEAVGARGTVRVAARRDGPWVAIGISDDGPGIRPEDVPRLFEPYFTTKEAGTGLGLAIAERIVKEHGGRIDVVSPPGGGATFTVRLPAFPA
jgi:two-component system, NtrC family, nitrogen regulation sensor histidine kinase NtrY